MPPEPTPREAALADEFQRDREALDRAGAYLDRHGVEIAATIAALRLVEYRLRHPRSQGIA